MLLRIGYDIEFEFAAPTPMVLLLNTSPNEAHRLLKPDFPQTEPFVPTTEFIDSISATAVTGWLPQKAGCGCFNDTLATDSGLPDVMVTDAPQHPVEDLPDECLQFLLGSRYCEVAEMLPIAWDLFGHTRAERRAGAGHLRLGLLECRVRLQVCPAHEDGFGRVPRAARGLPGLYPSGSDTLPVHEYPDPVLQRLHGRHWSAAGCEPDGL